MRVLLTLAAFAVAACGPLEEVSEPVPLLAPFALAPVGADADPLAQHRPDEIDCPSAGWGPDGGGFEVQTGVCNYASFDQPVSTTIKAGDTLNIVVWHDTLDSAEPALGHVAVWVGSTVVWEAEVVIPAASGLFDVSVPIEATPAPDARLGLHVRNHGYNSWRFVAVDLHRQ